MINTKELRIGNFIDYDGEEVKVLAIGENSIKFKNENIEGFEMFPSENYNYIKVTENKLLELGFEKKCDWYFQNEIFTIEKWVTKKKWDLRIRTSPEESTFLCQIKSIHELQNFYFLLKGEELTQVSEGENKNLV